MAFNNGFPITYPQLYYPQYLQPIQQQVQPPAQQQVQQVQYPLAQGGFVRVMSENEARMYPVAPGNSVTFINENAPYCYTKTVDMSQLDRPKFERYRLVKEEDAPTDSTPKSTETQQVDYSQFATKADISTFMAELESVRSDIETFRGDLYGLAGKKKVKKEESPDE